MKRMTTETRPAWTGEVVKKMHLYNITQTDVALEMGLKNKSYVSMILSGKRNPPDCRNRVKTALESLIERKLNA